MKAYMDELPPLFLLILDEILKVFEILSTFFQRILLPDEPAQQNIQQRTLLVIILQILTLTRTYSISSQSEYYTNSIQI